MTDAPGQGCPRYEWCVRRGRGHTDHSSVSVHGPDGDDVVLYAETAPESSEVVYGPVLGGEAGDRPVRDARVMAARLRVAAAQLEALAAWGDAG